VKYRILATCPLFSIGFSTGLAPIHVRNARVLIVIGIRTFFSGENLLDWFFFLFIVGFMNMMIDAASASTPPSFDGIDRRIAYANRKYHSGWMCFGVDRGLASREFSGSMDVNGLWDAIVSRITDMIRIGVRSFDENVGWNWVFSLDVVVPVVFDDPVS
jgi:hypothetical protein